MSTLLGVESRAGLVTETSTLRLAAILGASFAILVLLVLLVFFGFDSTPERLFVFSVGHLFISALALYASVRFGTALLLLVVLGVIQALLDAGQWIVRAITFSLTVEQILFLAANSILLFFALAYTGLAWRLWSITRKRGATLQTEPDVLLQQEANAIRLTALIGIAAAAVALIGALVLVSFDTRPVLLLLFSAGHLILGPYALWFGSSQESLLLPAILFGFAVLQLGLDITQLFLRLADIGPLEISLNNLLELILLLINIGFIYIDLAYLLVSGGLIYALWTRAPEEAAVDEEPPARLFGSEETEQPMSMSAMRVRQRRGKRNPKE